MCGGVGPSGFPIEKSMMSSPALPRRLLEIADDVEDVRRKPLDAWELHDGARQARLIGDHAPTVKPRRRRGRRQTPPSQVVGIRILHLARRRARDRLAVVARDDPQRHVDAGGDARRREHVAVLDDVQRRARP